MEVDFQQHYHLDLSTDLLDKRSQRWLAVRVLGLFGIESRLRYKIYPPADSQGGGM